MSKHGEFIIPCQLRYGGGGCQIQKPFPQASPGSPTFFMTSAGTVITAGSSKYWNMEQSPSFTPVNR